MTETDNSIASDSRSLGPGDQPVFTGDGIFAFALYMAGTKFAGERVWCVNYYTADILRKLGYSGMSMREGAKKAVKEGKPGIIRFTFNTPHQDVLRGYREQEREIEEAEGTAQNVFRDLLNDYKSGARSYGETAARVVCLLLKMRVKFMNEWKETVPLLRIDDNREPRTTAGTDGVRTVELGGFKLISVNASEETRQKLGL